MLKNPPVNAGDVGSVPGMEKFPGGGIFFLGNPMDRGTWRATVHGVAKSWTQLGD